MPVNTSGAAPALNIGVVGFVGTVLGMPLDALILGAFAGAMILGHGQVSSRAHGLSTVITSALLAGALSPALLGWAVHWLEFGGAEAEERMLKPLIPVLVGAAWPFVLPLLSDGIRQVWAAAVLRIIKWLDFGGGKNG